MSCSIGRMNERSTIFLKKSPSNFSSVHPFVCVGLSSTDTIQIINLPSQLIEPFKQVVRQFWTKGIQKESYENGVLKIKLAGNPWSETNLQSVMAKFLLQNIISTLYRHQYICTVNVDLPGKTMYFRYDPSLPCGGAANFCTISFNDTDRLQVMCAPAAIVRMIREVIQTVWSHGRIQDEKNHYGFWEFKISGNPWYSRKKESVMARYHYYLLIHHWVFL